MILVCYDAGEVWRNPGDRYYHNYNSGEQDTSIAATTMMYEAARGEFTPLSEKEMLIEL